MYSHFGLENANFNEYDTDIMLEYEDSDTYKDFKTFFYDILPEFQKFGKVVQLKVSLWRVVLPQISCGCILYKLLSWSTACFTWVIKWNFATPYSSIRKLNITIAS